MVTIILFFSKIIKIKIKNMLQKNKSNRLPLTPLIAHLVSANLLWRKKVPLKVLIFAWRLFRNKFPMKANLFYFEGELFNRMLSCVSAVVVRSNLMTISCFAAFLVMFGS